MSTNEMNYSLSARSSQDEEGSIMNRSNKLQFGVTGASDLSSPAELLIAAFAACCLKNVERFASFMKYTYNRAEIKVTATRQSKPPMIHKIVFNLNVYSDDTQINEGLLLRNLQKYGTIYNTLNVVCEIEGKLTVIES